MIKFTSLLIPIALASFFPANAAIVQYSSRSAFLAALAPGYLATDFSSLAPGDQGSTTLSLFGANPAATLLLESRDQANAFAGNNLWVSDLGNLDTAVGAATTFSDQLRLTNSGGFFAIGADWFLGDIDDNHLAGDVILTFSDNSTFTVSSSSQAGSFRGFISDVPLTSLAIRTSDPANVPGWASIDNLVTAAVPEPSAVLLGGITAAAGLIRRRRNA